MTEYLRIRKLLGRRANLLLDFRRSLLCMVLLVLTVFGQVTIAETALEDISAHYRFTNIASERLKPRGPQRAIVQDSQGYMWFGGFDGLMRFDGFDFTDFAHDPNDPTTLSSSKITTLQVDTAGVLWVGTANGLNRYNPKTQTFTRFLNPAKEPFAAKLNNIFTTAVDEHGQIWLASATAPLTKFNSKTERYETVPVDQSHRCDSMFEGVPSLLVEPGEGLWIGTSKGAICFLDSHTQTYRHFSLMVEDGAEIFTGFAEEIAKDPYGYLWVATRVGLFKLDPATGKSKHYSATAKKYNLPSSEVVDVEVDSQWNVWAALADGGLSLYLREQDRFVNFFHNPAIPGSLPSDKIWTIYRSPSDDLWFSHFPNSISMLDPYAKSFKNYNRSTPSLPLSHDEVLSVLEDEDGKIWVGTENGLTKMDFSAGKTQFFLHDPAQPTSIPARAVVSLMLDSSGMLWVGTWGGGACLFDRKTHECERFKGNDERLKNNSVNQVLEDSSGEIWLATSNGLFRYDRARDALTSYFPSKEDSSAVAGDYITALLEDSQRNLWVGTEHGLDRFDREQNIFIHHRNSDGNPRSLAEDQVRALREDRNGNIWVGTWGGGLSLYHPDTQDFTSFNSKHGLANQAVQGILEDTQGDIWLSTHNGLSQFKLKAGVFNNYGEEHGLAGAIFPRGAIIQARSGDIFVGGTHGLTVFKPNQIYRNSAVPAVRITRFYLFNQPVSHEAENSPLSLPIEETEAITLNYKQSVFAFDFAALNFKIPARNQFKYRLTGFDANWQLSGSRRTAIYTNIDPGDYVFQVLGSNNDGVWNEHGASIKIRILPPWWQTWWAYLLYSAALLAAVALFVYSQKYKRLLVEEQNRKLLSFDRLKDDFIANTSHELRTPLNGIIGLADSLVEGAAGEVSELMAMNLRMISVSGQRLASLVNDILDFSKLKNHEIELNLQPLSLHEIAEYVVNMCIHIQKASGVRLVNQIDPTLTAVLADDERLQQILYNLIGNALKFTHQGSVTLTGEENSGFVWVNIVDTGIGIPADSLDKIFNSFEQLERHDERVYGGTGLGLAVTKRLVELHGGVIKVQSQEGVGSCFSFSLRATDARPSMALMNKPRAVTSVAKLTIDAPKVDIGTGNTPHNDRTHDSIPSNSSANAKPSVDAKAKPSVDANAHPNTQFKILIVDDDVANQQVLINQLSLQHYRFEVANDGLEALIRIERDGPFDLVLLDVMMPQMSGYEVCSSLRKVYPKEVLPIIFLTAKNGIEDLTTGFQAGANDFLTKPISINELNLRVQTHLQLLEFNRSLERLVDTRTSELELAHGELKTMDGIAAAMNQEVKIDRLISVILSQTNQLIPHIDYLAYWKFNPTNSCFTLLYTDIHNDTWTRPTSIDPHSMEIILLKPECKIAEHIYVHASEFPQGVCDLIPGLPQAQSMLCLSFLLADNVVEILVFGAQRADAFGVLQTAHYERLRMHIQSVLGNARLVEALEAKCDELEQMSLTDQLTGMGNRHFLSKHIEQDIALIQRRQFSLGQDPSIKGLANESDLIFFLVDLDYFKEVNDAYGHSVGDFILSNMRSVFKQVLRNTDYCIRWGGEEFLIVARFCDRQSAPNIAEQIRSALASFEFEIGPERTLSITCSIGFASYPFCKAQPEAFTWSEVINIADLALYSVKESQRNGWLGISYSGEVCDKNLYANILENPQQQVARGNIVTVTNLPQIDWPSIRKQDNGVFE